LGKELFHKDFKLQGETFNSVKELIDFSKSISEEVQLFLVDWFNGKTFVEVKTSGSTGIPKIIQLQKKHMVNSAIATGSFFNLPEKTSALLCMSVNYIAGKMMLVRALTLGWHIDVLDAVSNPLKKLKKSYDFSAMVPLQLDNSLKDIHKIKKLIVGGGVVSNELLEKIQDVETDIFATYGMTETITHIAVKKLNHFKLATERSRRESNYNTLPNIFISKDKRGCLVIEAPKVSNDVIITNDLVEIISENSFKWLGRFDTVINSGGVKLIPEQIEEKLSKIIEQRFFITGVKDSLLGEKLILLIEGVKNDAIQTKVKELDSLSKFEIPKEIYFLEKFIETPTQKIQRNKTIQLL